MSNQGRFKEAEAAYRRAIELKPDYPEAHYNLGIVLSKQGRFKEAEAAYRRATELNPDFPEAHCNLGMMLRQLGRYGDALASLRQGHELGSKDPRWPYPSGQWLREAERLATLEAKLPALLEGQARPADAAERIAIAVMCQEGKQLYAAAARFYGDAFADQPRLADDLQAAHRYNAACAAALAAAGQGEDAAMLEDGERARLRRQALDWLRADLEEWARQVKSGQPQAGAAVVKKLRHWQTDPGLAGVRDAAALEKLPEAERGPWRKLWLDLAALVEKADGPGAAGK